MSSSLFSGLSGLSSYQRMLDVVGNNLANTNTPAFKKSTILFADQQSNTYRPASAPTQTVGGVNPSQVGNGVQTAAIQVDNTQGVLKSTGNSLDMGIQGEGYFVLNDGLINYYTRVGSFSIDSNNYLVDSATGFKVQGLSGDILIQQDATIPPTPTTQVTLGGNLDVSTQFPGGTPVTTTINVLDTLGRSHSLDLAMTRLSDSEWKLDAVLSNGDGTFTDSAIEGFRFNPNGSYGGLSAGDADLIVTFDGLTDPQTITLNLGTLDGFDGLTQYEGDTSATAISQNGSGSGSLASISVTPEGNINGIYTNGTSATLAELGIATFANPEGLAQFKDNLFLESYNSGQAVIGKGLSGRAGSVQGGFLESSNVDLTVELANMIIAQRGFQVNARVITVTDKNLEEAVNLTR